VIEFKNLDKVRNARFQDRIVRKRTACYRCGVTDCGAGFSLRRASSPHTSPGVLFRETGEPSSDRVLKNVVLDALEFLLADHLHEQADTG
jgi:hypothetical protein